MELDQIHQTTTISSSSSYGRYFASTAAMAVAQPNLNFILYAAVFVWVTMLRKFSISFFALLKSKPIAEDNSGDDEDDEAEVVMCSKDDFRAVLLVMGMQTTGEVGELKERNMSSMFEEKEPSVDEVDAAFSVFDVNGDGFIDAVDLHKLLSKLGFEEGRDLKVCQKMIDAYDQNMDGRIDFEEFVKFLEGCFSA